MLLILFSYMWKLFWSFRPFPRLMERVQNRVNFCRVHNHSVEIGEICSKLFFHKKFVLSAHLGYLTDSAIFSRNIFHVRVKFLFFHTVDRPVSEHIHCINISWLLQMNIQIDNWHAFSLCNNLIWRKKWMHQTQCVN